MEKAKLLEMYQILGSLNTIEEYLENAIKSNDMQAVARALTILKRRDKKLEELIDSEYYKD